MSETEEIQEPQPPKTMWRRFVRAFRWLFVRRLAIKPPGPDKDGFCYDYNPESCPQRVMWEWQKMPEGWRWF